MATAEAIVAGAIPGPLPGAAHAAPAGAAAAFPLVAVLPMGWSASPSIFMGATRGLLCRIAPAPLVQLHENVKDKAELAGVLRLAREEKELSNKCKMDKTEKVRVVLGLSLGQARARVSVPWLPR